MFDVEAVVVGAGVVGLAIARALCNRGIDVMVVERNATIGSETSARNSEVIHAGIYYPQNSLKAQLCVRGRQLMDTFCKENNVNILPCGKLLLATSEQEVPALHKLKDNGFKNGVNDLVLLSRNQTQKLEPDVHCEWLVYRHLPVCLTAMSLCKHSKDISNLPEAKLFSTLPSALLINLVRGLPFSAAKPMTAIQLAAVI